MLNSAGLYFVAMAPEKSAEITEFDSEAFERFYAEGEETSPEILEIFLTDTPEKLGAISGELSSGKLRDARRFAHSLKSSSAFLGAVALSRACARMEAAIERGDPAGRLSELLADMETAFGTVSEELRSRLAEKAR